MAKSPIPITSIPINKSEPSTAVNSVALTPPIITLFGKYKSIKYTLTLYQILNSTLIGFPCQGICHHR